VGASEATSLGWLKGVSIVISMMRDRYLAVPSFLLELLDITILITHTFGPGLF